MFENEPVYGSVSWDRSIFVLHHKRKGNITGYTQGYSKDMFDGFSGPIIRFDKAKKGDVIESILGPVIPIEGVDIPLMGDKPVTLEAYLEKMKNHNIPVEMGYQD